MFACSTFAREIRWPKQNIEKTSIELSRMTLSKFGNVTSVADSNWVPRVFQGTLQLASRYKFPVVSQADSSTRL